MNKIKGTILEAIKSLGYPSIREIEDASKYYPNYIWINDLSYQRLYYELWKLTNRKSVRRFYTANGHRLRFSVDFDSLPIKKIIKSMVALTLCKHCGARCIFYLGKKYRIRSDSECNHCYSTESTLRIIKDPMYGLNYILDDVYLLGVIDLYGVRLPGSIRGYGTEYIRIVDLVKEETGKKPLLTVIGHVE